jgi:hypothetical protein
LAIRPLPQSPVISDAASNAAMSTCPEKSKGVDQIRESVGSQDRWAVIT